MFFLFVWLVTTLTTPKHQGRSRRYTTARSAPRRHLHHVFSHFHWRRVDLPFDDSQECVAEFKQQNADTFKELGSLSQIDPFKDTFIQNIICMASLFTSLSFRVTRTRKMSMIRVVRPSVLRKYLSGQRQSYMSSMTVSTPEEENHFALILGKPGGGKGTISGKILKDFPQFQHISTGDILRSHVREQTALGKEAKAYMDNGDLVPDTLMIDLVMDEATPSLEDGKSLLLDGFPRTVNQAEALEKVVHVDMVINLDIPTETIVERIADRWIHPGSGRIYSYSYNPPKQEGIDDVTGEPLVQRPDDQPDCVRQRLQAYDDVTSPLVDYYSKMGVLRTFQGTMSDVIYPRVKEWLEKKLD